MNGYRLALCLLIIMHVNVCNAKLSVTGEIKNNHYELMTRLANLNDQDPAFQNTHTRWIIPIWQMLTKLDAGLLDSIPNDSSAVYFNQRDAVQILRPILKNNYGFNLSDELIQYFPIFANHQLLRSKINDSVHLKTNEAKEDTYNTTLELLSLAKGQVVVFLGNSPVYISAMLQRLNSLLSQQDQITIIDLPISGSPDLADTDQVPELRDIAFRNILTQDKEIFYRKMLIAKGFVPGEVEFNQYSVPRKIFCVDFQGDDLASAWFNLVARWYHDAKINLPNIHYVTVNGSVDASTTQNSTNFITQLSFNDLDFKVDSYQISLAAETFNESKLLQDDMQVVPEFYSVFWKLESEHWLEDYPRQPAAKLYRKYQNYAEGQFSNISS